MFARFDENPAMTLRVIKETKRYGRTDARTDNGKTVYPLQTKFAGGITILYQGSRGGPSLSRGVHFFPGGGGGGPNANFYRIRYNMRFPGGGGGGSEPPIPTSGSTLA